jgi:hypothetical protein
MSFKKLRSDAFGVTFAETSDPDYTVRFKTSQSYKSLDGNSVQNVVTEIIVNDVHMTDLGDGHTVPEALSVRIKVSGSHYGKARKEAMLSAIAAQLDTWATEGVFDGFEPTTVPVAAI